MSSTERLEDSQDLKWEASETVVLSLTGAGTGAVGDYSNNTSISN